MSLFLMMGYAEKSIALHSLRRRIGKNPPNASLLAYCLLVTRSRARKKSLCQRPCDAIKSMLPPFYQLYS